MAEPTPLGRLMLQVIDRDGYESIAELARQTRAVSYQLIYAWISGKPPRNLKRPPPAHVLSQLAADLRLPESVVFTAAGRAHENTAVLTGQDAEFVAILRDIPAAQRQDVIMFASLAGQLAPEDRQIALRLIRDLGARGA